MRKGNTVKQTMSWCLNCGNTAIFFRDASELKQNGHLKHMYCAKCKDRTPHLENLDKAVEKIYGRRF